MKRKRSASRQNDDCRAVGVVLRLYANPERLVERLPTLRVLARSLESIRNSAESSLAAVAAKLHGVASVEVIECDSQIGSGALPTQTIPSAGLAIRPSIGKRGSGAALERLASAFRNLPVPVIGRLQDGALILDFRCLEDEAAFVAQLPNLALSDIGLR